MPFDIHQLDNLDYEDAERLLEAYEDAIIEQFAQSPEGQAFFEQNGSIGLWVQSLINLGYSYEGMTLPRMRQSDMQLILENLFPRKISLIQPEDADDVIPELIAFWQFLKREYRFKNADATLKYLEKLQPRYREIMNDASRFGMAKSFMTAGMQAGFDMTTQEGLTAFQLQYNANLMTESADSPLNALAKLATLGASAQSKKTKSQGKGKGAIASEKGFGNAKVSQKSNRKKK
jgi:hypothetical protein